MDDRAPLPGASRQRDSITNFDQDLSERPVFYSLLVGYWPSLNSYSKFLKKNPRETTKLGRTQTRGCMLRSLQLPHVLAPEDILGPDPRDMLLYCGYLYQTLPQFIRSQRLVLPHKLG